MEENYYADDGYFSKPFKMEAFDIFYKKCFDKIHAIRFTKHLVINHADFKGFFNEAIHDFFLAAKTKNYIYKNNGKACAMVFTIYKCKVLRSLRKTTRILEFKPEMEINSGNNSVTEKSLDVNIDLLFGKMNAAIKNDPVSFSPQLKSFFEHYRFYIRQPMDDDTIREKICTQMNISEANYRKLKSTLKKTAKTFLPGIDF